MTDYNSFRHVEVHGRHIRENWGYKLFIDALAPAHNDFVNLLNETLTNTNKPVTKLTDVKRDSQSSRWTSRIYIDLQISDEPNFLS